MKEKMSLKIAPAEMIPEAVEVMPEDGQTENLPDPQLDAMTEESAAVGLPDFSPTMTTTNEGFYSRDEFRQNFNSFLEFLENPATATDAFSTIVGKGRDLSADKIYNLAERYNWLKWIIDRKTQAVSDLLLVTIFVTFESNLIIQNWTGISYIERLKLWLKNKAKQRKEAVKAGRFRSLFGWGSSAPRDPVKVTGPGN